MNYVYIVRCSDGSFYTGWTNHLEQRIRKHNTGLGAKYTRSRRPVQLIYYETFETSQLARRREYQIKQLDHKGKERLVLNGEGFHPVPDEDCGMSRSDGDEG